MPTIRTVVCFGDSITRGLISASYIELLEQRMGGEGYRFVNSGVNNDYAYNLVLRAGQVIAKDPQYITILVGTNDVIAMLAPIEGRVASLWKGLPNQPSLEWYRHKLLEVVRHLKIETAAHIALLSLPVLGEDLDTTPNLEVCRFNAVIQETAAAEDVAYLPLYERQAETLRASGSYPGKPYFFSLLPTLESIEHHIFRHESLDEFSKRMGYLLLTDGVHLNSRGASLVADEIEAFLRANP